MMHIQDTIRGTIITEEESVDLLFFHHKNSGFPCVSIHLSAHTHIIIDRSQG